MDFYQFSCGGWRAKNPLPADKARYNRYDEMGELNLARMRTLLEAAAQPGDKHDRAQQQAGDYFAACMDESAVERAGDKPITAYFSRIASLKDKQAMLTLAAQLDDDGLSMMFSFGATPDRHNSSIDVAELDQGGLTLPDRDYYLKTDAQSAEQREEYKRHVAKMFSFLGASESDGKSDGEIVLRLETEMAKASMDRTARRTPENLDHKMAVADFNRLAPSLYFADFAKAANAPGFDSLTLPHPTFSVP